MDNKEKIQIFNYKGTVISFENSAEGKFISATQMVKAFKGKRIQEFFRLKQTLEYINELNNHLNQEELEIPPELFPFHYKNGRSLKMLTI
jgi:NifU-like protein involved in Fe-S cluster formation